MVTILGFESRINSQDKSSFNVLKVSSPIARVSASGNVYVDAKQVTVPTPLDEVACQAIVGQKLPGSVKQTACAEYEWLNPSTGEVEKRTTTWSYVPYEVEA